MSDSLSESPSDQPSRQPAWLVDEPFTDVDHGVVKSGKEAQVNLVERIGDDGFPNVIFPGIPYPVIIMIVLVHWNPQLRPLPCVMRWMSVGDTMA